VETLIPDGAGARDRRLAPVGSTGLSANQLLMVTFHQKNQVWDVPGLYVADASVFPSASGVNPMLTIMGIAHRAATVINSR